MFLENKMTTLQHVFWSPARDEVIHEWTVQSTL